KPSAHSPEVNMGWQKCSGIRFSYLDAWTFPVLIIKRLGLFKEILKLNIILERRYPLNVINFDVQGELLVGVETFVWSLLLRFC
ncbi:DUF5983 family protein, partial [Enterobacter hormaechei]